MSTDIFDMNLAEMDFAVFDVEATGRIPAKDAVIQMAVVTIEGGKIQPGGWSSLVNPGEDFLPLDDFIVDFTKITTEEIRSAPDMATAMAEFDTNVGRRVVAGQNIRRYDIPIMRKHAIEVGISPQLDLFFDTLIVAGKLMPSPRKLADIAKHYEIEIDPGQQHNALYDSQIAAKIVLAQIDDLSEKGVTTFGEMLDFV